MDKHKLTTLIKPETYAALAAKHGSRGIGHAIDEMVKNERDNNPLRGIERTLERLLVSQETHQDTKGSQQMV